MENQSKEIRDLIAEETRRRRGAKIAKTSDQEFIEFLAKENRLVNRPITLSDVIKNSAPKIRENLIARIALKEIRSYINQISKEHQTGLISTECDNFNFLRENDIIEIASSEYEKAINAIALKTIAKVFPRLKEVREKRKEDRRNEKIAAAYRIHFERFFASSIDFDQYMNTIAPSIPAAMILQIVEQ